MSFFIGLFSWLVIAAVLVTGIVLAVKGTFWLLIVGALAFLAVFAKYGCAAH